MKRLLILTCVACGLPLCSYAAPMDSTANILGTTWIMDSTYFINGSERNGASAYGKNVWEFAANGLLLVTLESLDPMEGSYEQNGALLTIHLFGSKDLYHILQLDEHKLRILIDAESGKVISESVFVTYKEEE